MPRSIHIPAHGISSVPAFNYLRELVAHWYGARRERRALRQMLEAGPRLVVDAGWEVPDARMAAGSAAWRSDLVPPLRPF